MTGNNIFNRLVKYFLENRLITFIFLIVFVVMGLVTMPFNLKSGLLPRNPVPVDAIPDIGENQQIVATEWMVVEDNAGDTRLIKEVLNESKIFNTLFFVKDGVEAINFLYKKGKYSDAPKPDLIILDLNLPKKDGREVLAEIKNDTGLMQIPVVIMTTSQAERSVKVSY